MNHIDEITKKIGRKFSTFGGGHDGGNWNPIAIALKNEPLQFAAGVDVRAIVAFVAAEVALERETVSRFRACLRRLNCYDRTDAADDRYDPPRYIRKHRRTV